MQSSVGSKLRPKDSHKLGIDSLTYHVLAEFNPCHVWVTSGFYAYKYTFFIPESSIVSHPMPQHEHVQAHKCLHCAHKYVNRNAKGIMKRSTSKTMKKEHLHSAWKKKTTQ